MNTFIFTQRHISARLFAMLTVISLLLSAFPAAFFVAEAQDVEPPEYFCKALGNGKFKEQTFQPILAQNPQDGESSGLLGPGVNAGDIIPPFGNFDGYNWPSGKTIWDNFCNPLPTTGSITIAKVAGNSTTTEFDFTGTGGIGAFTLVGGSDEEFEDLDPGEYTITESVTDAWELLDITCEGVQMNDDIPSVAIDLEAGEDVTCIFTNRPDQEEGDEAKIKVFKWIVGNETGPAALTDFSFQIDEEDPVSFNQFGFGYDSVSAGTHVINEVDIPEDYDHLKTICKVVDRYNDRNEGRAISRSSQLLTQVVPNGWQNYPLLNNEVTLDEGDIGVCLIINEYDPDSDTPNMCTVEAFSDTGTVVVENNTYAVETYEHPNWTASIPGADWVWELFNVANPEATTTKTFHESFTVGGASSATLDVASDNSYKVRINGTLVADVADLDNFTNSSQDNYDVISYIVDGVNTLDIEVTNAVVAASTPESNPAGVLYKLVVEGENRCDLTTTIDEEPPEKEYAPYCGDDKLNQAWEQCDGTEGCTTQCQEEDQNQCTDLTLAKINIENVENQGAGDMTDDIYLGQGALPIPNDVWFMVYGGGVYANDPDVTGYEDVPGLAVQRLNGSVRSVMYGSQRQAEEHSDGTVSFWSWDDSVAAEAVVNDNSGNNTLEGDYTDGSGIGSTNAGDDEISIDGDIAKFWLTTTVQDDGFYTEYSEPVVCEDCEDELDGGWADFVEDYSQANKKDGSSITDVNRTDPNAALNEADWSGSTGFFSLGFGGWIEAGFDNYVPNVVGDDISIHEATNGTYPLESALVEVSQNGSDWYEIGTADNTAGDKVTYLDISDASVPLTWIKYVRVTDTTNPTLHANDADGFDLDAIDATQTLCEMPQPPEPLVCDPEVNLIENGGFEAPLVAASTYEIFYTGEPLLEWITGDYGIEIQNNIAGTPYAGSQHAELDPEHPTMIWQEIATVPGETYTFSTQYSPRPGRDLEDNRFEFLLNGSTLGASIARDGSANLDTVWTYEERMFVATSSTTTVGFVETGTDSTYGAYLDNVALRCIPGQEPVTYRIDGYKYETDGEATTTLAGWTINLEDDNSTVLMSTTTDGNGYYYFDVLAGDYEVHEVIQTDWTQVEVRQDGELVETDADIESCGFSVPEESDYSCDFTNEDVGTTGPILGCTDPQANNYNPAATEDDGSCDYTFVSQCVGTPNLLVNASFEEPVVTDNGGTWEIFSSVPNWLISLSDGLELWRGLGVGASDGEQNVELAGNSATKITQTVTTIPGATYELSFDFAARSDASDAANNHIEAAADGVSLVNVSTSSDNWLKYGATFVANASTTNVSFVDLGTQDGTGTLLDNTSLCLVSLPDDDEEGEGDNDEPQDPVQPVIEDDEPQRSTGGTATRVRRPSPQPQVLGASTMQCGMYLSDYMRQGQGNDDYEVTKLQLFLNGQGYFIPVTGVFDAATDQAVRSFQQVHHLDVLDPWFNAGIVPHNNPTGYVYQLTRWKINNIVCPGSELYPPRLI